ncbi:MAG TPA: O-methyltransferase [Polyangia bacterium]|jgi:caffeoyl-CoA O-methyltransferase|nr:O-methyltransferase [Polyangia bacterium]
MADTTSRTGVTYATPEILGYLQRVHVPHDGGLEQAFTAPGHHGVPAIQVGPSEGKLLELLARLVAARRVVEVGTLMGYSTIHLARGMAPGGRLWTCEYDPKHARLARHHLAAAGLSDRVEVVEGAALDTLPGIEGHGPFDVVFIDADKQNYDHYGRWALRHLRPGGLLIGDNVYLFGRLLEDGPEAAAMRRFHEEAAAACHSVCVPTPDGLLLGVRR